MNANEAIKALRICSTHIGCPEDCPGDRTNVLCLFELHQEAARLLEAALADMKRATPCAICAHYGTPECYFRQRGMFCRELPGGGKFTWRGLTQEGKENKNGQ